MAQWGYLATNGPATWEKDFPVAKGKRQSPIDIVTSSAKYDNSLGPLKISYTPEKELCLKNNGHTIMCQITEKQSELTGGPLTDTYRLEQFHLHWGSKDNQGSEHTIDGKSYAAELHLVHWNTKYGEFSKAVSESDGLAVLGIMISVDGEDNAGFKAITDNIAPLVKSGSDKKVANSFDAATLLPANTSQYWTYEGSLTTPPLLESVQWIVFKEPVKYSADQMKKLRSLIDADAQCMQDNFRPPLPTGNRKVRASFQ